MVKTTVLSGQVKVKFVPVYKIPDDPVYVVLVELITFVPDIATFVLAV